MTMMGTVRPPYAMAGLAGAAAAAGSCSVRPGAAPPLSSPPLPHGRPQRPAPPPPPISARYVTGARGGRCRTWQRDGRQPLAPPPPPPPVLGPARGGVGSWLSPAPAGNGGAKGQALGARAASELLGKLGGGEEGPAGEPAAASPKTFPETATQGQEKNRRKIQSANREA